MPIWTIEGQASKPWDATPQALEFRAIESAQLSFRSLDVDTLDLGIIPEDFTTYTAPELGQTIKLYRNGSLFFTGTVTDVQTSVTATAQGLTVTVSGPWWWMERVNYTSTQTDGTGGTATRMTGVFGDATSGTNLQTAIQTAINNIAALGVPIANIAGGSSVAAFFSVPRVTLNQGTCAFVITELCRLVPDAMAYFDYSTATPTLQVTRRGVATTRTITLGTDEVDTLNIRPMFEMKVDQVALPFVERDILGRTKFNQQSSGTAATGRVQVITVSGPELDTFLPNDLFEVQPVRTYTSVAPIAYDISGTFTGAREKGMAENSIGYGPATYTVYSTSGLSGTPRSYSTSSPVASDESGKIISLTGRNLLSPESVEQWAVSEYNLTKVTITGTWGYWHIESNDLGQSFPYPEWLSTLSYQVANPGSGYTRRTGSASGYLLRTLFVGTYSLTGYLSPAQYHWTGAVRVGSTATTIVLATTASAIDDFYIGRTISWTILPSAVFSDTIIDYNGTTKVATVSQSWPTSQRASNGVIYKLDGHPLYRPADYSFITPPANLAANLLAAQNFVPYEGEIGLTQEVAGAVLYRGCKVNVANSIAEHATMGALVSAETLDLKTGTTRIELGTPARVDYRTFVDRIRKTPQDNIVFV